MLAKIRRTFSFINHHPLARKSLVRAYVNFIIWQFQSIIQPNKYIIKSFFGDINFYAKRKLTGITGNIYTGLHEFNDMGFLLHFLRASDTFFDIGANVGSYTLLASGYAKATTLAFEPALNTFQILEKNISLNKLQNRCKIYNHALGRKKGTLQFTSNLDTVNHVVAANEVVENATTTDVLILDDFIDHYPILIKIDVEGFEYEVIEGGKELLEKDTTIAIIIELNGSGSRYGYEENSIHIYLLQIGFMPYHYNPFSRNFTLLNNFGQFNTIYIKNLDFVENRCATANAVNLFGTSF